MNQRPRAWRWHDAGAVRRNRPQPRAVDRARPGRLPVRDHHGAGSQRGVRARPDHGVHRHRGSVRDADRRDRRGDRGLLHRPARDQDPERGRVLLLRRDHLRQLFRLHRGLAVQRAVRDPGLRERDQLRAGHPGFPQLLLPLRPAVLAAGGHHRAGPSRGDVHRRPGVHRPDRDPRHHRGRDHPAAHDLPHREGRRRQLLRAVQPGARRPARVVHPPLRLPRHRVRLRRHGRIRGLPAAGRGGQEPQAQRAAGPDAVRRADRGLLRARDLRGHRRLGAGPPQRLHRLPQRLAGHGRQDQRGTRGPGQPGHHQQHDRRRAVRVQRGQPPALRDGPGRDAAEGAGQNPRPAPYPVRRRRRIRPARAGPDVYRAWPCSARSARSCSS